MRLDMTANASILGERHENVLAVPATAVRSGGQGAFGGQGGFAGRTAQGGQAGQNQPGDQAAPSDPNAQSGRERVSRSFVLMLVDGQLRPVPVTVGLTAGDLTEVSGDLKEGDEVLAGELTLPGPRRQHAARYDVWWTGWRRTAAGDAAAVLMNNEQWSSRGRL